MSLILVPTAKERDQLQPRLLGDGLAERHWQIATCGFGPIAAAARTMALIHAIRPPRVILVGIAGTFGEDRLPIGSATAFDAVACDGVGVGTGSDHRPASSLGWTQWQGTAGSIGDRISLTRSTDTAAAPVLLTVCAASANPAEAAQRRSRCPDAWAEDMEGYGAALSCQVEGVPLQIVRGVSNRVGDREPGNWKIDAALAAAADLTRQLVLAATTDR